MQPLLHVPLNYVTGIGSKPSNTYNFEENGGYGIVSVDIDKKSFSCLAFSLLHSTSRADVAWFCDVIGNNTAIIAPYELNLSKSVPAQHNFIINM